MYHRLEVLKGNPRVQSGPPPSVERIEDAQRAVDMRFPELIKAWITEYGCIQINPIEAEKRTSLILFGIGHMCDSSDDIVLNNSHENTARLPGSLVFARENDGTKEIAFACNRDQEVLSTTDFAFADYPGNPSAPMPEWKTAYRSIESFWDSKVKEYLVL